MASTVAPLHDSSADALLGRILDALAKAGHDVGNLSADVLAPIDHLNALGLPATLRLAAAAGIAADDVVLDIGCGVGGPARTLAADFGCQIVGVDVSPAFCETAAELNRRCGLDDLIEVRLGDATDLPCEDAEFTVAWTQHASMNIAAKAELFAEMRRSLVAGGRLAFFDVLASSDSDRPVCVPLPWAEEEVPAVLATPEQTTELVGEAGFAIRHWDDVTDSAAEHLAALIDSRSASDALGVHLVVPDVAERAAALARNLDEGRLRLVQCVADSV